jgi:NUBPL iron-transfer P-loop NTPase
VAVKAQQRGPPRRANVREDARAGARDGLEHELLLLSPCGRRDEIFGHGGARVVGQHLGAEFLGEVPLLLDIRTASDAGTPIAASAPVSEAAKAFRAIATRVWEKVSGATVARSSGPRIVMN